jgi:hypothetical protein
MRRAGLYLFSLISILLSLSTLSLGQPWSSILAPSRAINWSNAGLPATLPDGETTPNPWTPPSRTQCGSTIASGATPATINAALAACATGTYVLLGGSVGSPATFTFSSTNLTLYAQNGVTLRGSGAQATKLLLTGTSQIQFGKANNIGICAWASGYSAGTTSITINSCSGPPLVAGNIVSLQQCDTGYSGSGCTAGSASDNGGLYICGYNQGICNTDAGTAGHEWQQQMVYVTSVKSVGAGTYTVTFTPGIYMPNWSSGNTPTITWITPGGSAAQEYGAGLEDLTVDTTGGDTDNSPINMSYTYASWVKGVRAVGQGAAETISMAATKNCLFFNNYIFGTSTFNGDYFLVQTGDDSDDLVINNIGTGGTFWEGTGQTEGDVIAYNFNRDAETSYSFNRLYQHEAGSAFTVYEGNEVGATEDDNVWGTHDLNTWFRNYAAGWDPPYTASLQVGQEFDSFSRFENAIGNAIGSTALANYQSTYSATESDPVFGISLASNDALTVSSLMRWGNCDTVTATCRFNTGEVPATLTGNAIPFENSVPSNDNLPCSFFLAGYTGTTCTPKYGGGTGLSFWKVCKTWTTFPTSCATTQTQPFPIAGPDITSGLYVNGTAYDNPAEVALLNLPIDTNYQSSFTITGSSWSGGTETLTVSGLSGTSNHIMGPFQISGGACSTGSGEVYITTSTSTTIQYALASNPGSCTGTMRWPDVREFDERVYENDPASGAIFTIAPSSGMFADWRFDDFVHSLDFDGARLKTISAH